MTIILLPNTLFEDQEKKRHLGQDVFASVAKIDGLFAESERAGRRYLSHFQTKISFRDIPIVLINEHTKKSEMSALLKPIQQNKAVWGLVSDCGLPCVADPGEELVQSAYALGLDVQTLPGPCALIYALQLSGLNAERFAFRGYLPRDKEERRREIKELESRIVKHKETQIVMEAPYRNKELFLDMLDVLTPSCWLVVCINITHGEQKVMRKTVAEWRKMAEFPFEKAPALFVMGTEH